MRAFRGCTNPYCKAYKKVHYKKEDHFCLKCGETLSFICADCWKAMEYDKEKYCTSCKALREQKRAQTLEKAKEYSTGAVAAVGAIAAVVGKLGKDADKITDGGKTILRTSAKIVKMVKK